jgi:phytanoyl-CoA hydroxylase
MTDQDTWYFKYTGYHILSEILPEELVDRLNTVTSGEIDGIREPIVWEDKQDRRPEQVRRLSKVLDRDPVYMEAASHPLILDAVQAYLGPNIELLTNKHNHIMVRPGGSFPVPWHSGEEPWEPTLITALIYFEESTIENGCVRIVPGSHMRPFNTAKRPGGEWESAAEFTRALPVPVQKGGVLLFNDCCYHGSDVNRTDTSRRSMTVGYRTHDSHDVFKDDPEKILVRGERIYAGHQHPFPKS